MLSVPDTVRINVRVSKHMYQAASEKAAAERANGVRHMGRQMTVTLVINEALRRYVEEELDALESI